MPFEADIFTSCNFRIAYPKYYEDELLFINDTFRVTFGVFNFSYDTLMKLFASDNECR